MNQGKAINLKYITDAANELQRTAIEIKKELDEMLDSGSKKKPKEVTKT